MQNKYITFLLALFLIMVVFSVNAQKNVNLLMILADDMGYSDLGCYGGEISTPNLDKLAENGLRFTQFYNAARCCPSRASLLTGLYPHQAGIGDMTNDMGLPGYRGDLNQQSVTIAEALKEKGYYSFISGKWHVTKHVDSWKTWKEEDKRIHTSKYNWPLQRGFDEFFGTIHGAGSYFNPSTLTKNNTPLEADEDFYYTDAITDHAVEQIKNSSGHPFFGYISYTAPHWPLHALPEDIEKYKGKYDKGWDKVREERLDRMLALGLLEKEWRLSERDPEIKPWELMDNKEWWATCMEVYAAMVERMDQGIGRIIQALEESGELDNTLIVFLSDNGGCDEVLSDNWPKSLHFPSHKRNGEPLLRGNDVTVFPGSEDTYMSYSREWANVSNTPFRLYKHYIHEGGISTPFIVHWPNGLSTNFKINHQIGHIIDIMPTFLEVAGANYPEKYNGEEIIPMEGQSLMPLFRGETFKRKPLAWEHQGNEGYRDGNWKLVKRRGEGTAWELYDLESDRIEQNNLAGTFPDLTKSMILAYEEWANRVGVMRR
jgi:arylsulfatase A-like enzyme